MVHPNPYTYPNGVTIELRDSKGRYSTISKAKYLYLYVDGKFQLFDEFPKVNMSASDKFLIVGEYAKEFYLAKPEPKAKKPKKKPTKKRASLKKKVEPKKRIDEEFPEEFDDELSRDLYKDLLKEIEEEAPPKLKFKKDGIEVKTITAVLFDSHATIEKFHSALKEPVVINLDNLDIMKLYLEKELLEKFKKHYYDSTPGIDMFIPRITYNSYKKKDGRIVKELQGVGEGRTAIRNWNDLERTIKEMLIPRVLESFNRYLSTKENQGIELTGITLENLVNTIGPEGVYSG